MIRVMLDTDQPEQLTGSKIRAPILATYADLMGPPASLLDLRKEWPQVVLIDRGLGDPRGLATVIDIERGTHGPGDAPAWYDRQHKAGLHHLTVYCDRAILPAVNAAMGARSYFRWVATLDGTAHVAPFTPGQGPAAVQILPADRLGFHADLSLVLEDWWHPAPAPRPPLPPDVAKALLDAEQSVQLLTETVAALRAIGSHP